MPTGRRFALAWNSPLVMQETEGKERPDVTPLALNVLSFVSGNVREGLEDLHAARSTVLSMRGLGPEERLFLEAALRSRPEMEEFETRFLAAGPPARRPSCGTERHPGRTSAGAAHRPGPESETLG
ncbi:MAG: hypothetical protein GF400_01655 [Candidatus Eisenbacteria bacterium]|nr:hypothetical protein [Candidatus Eisenbacteria bacterium]